MKARRAIALAFVLCILISISPVSVSAALLPSPWAENELELARQWGLLSTPADYAESYTKGITKDAFTQMAVTMCKKLLGRPICAADVRFDGEDVPGYYYEAYAAGIVNGIGRGADGAVILGRNEIFSREQIAKMLYQAIVFCYPDEAMDDDSASLSLAEFADFKEISDWGRTPCAYMARLGVIKGVGGKFLPKSQCTVEQGIVLLARTYRAFAQEQALAAAPMWKSWLNAPEVLFPSGSAPSVRVQDSVVLKWAALRGAVEYLIQADFPGARSIQRTYTTATQILLQQPPNQSLIPGQLSVSIVAVDAARNAISPCARLGITLYNAPDFCFDFKDSAEAAKYMTTVDIKVWDFDETGQKVTKTKSVTVHKCVAGDVVAIFDEIYNGPERFPIHSVDGYRPGAGGEHPKGTAMDINPSENYEVWKDGRVGVGSFWKPGENPYSIPPDGDVVKAFRSHGWGWGGTDWRTKHDYMHFSYFGT